MEEWGTILTKYPINLLSAYSTWTLVIEFLATRKIPTPVISPDLTLEGFNSPTDKSPYDELMRALWQAARIEYASAKGVTPLMLKFRSGNLSSADTLRAQNSEGSAFGIELNDAIKDLSTHWGFQQTRSESENYRDAKHRTGPPTAATPPIDKRPNLHFGASPSGDPISRLRGGLLPVVLPPSSYRSFPAVQSRDGAHGRYF